MAKIQVRGIHKPRNKKKGLNNVVALLLLMGVMEFLIYEVRSGTFINSIFIIIFLFVNPDIITMSNNCLHKFLQNGTGVLMYYWINDLGKKGKMWGFTKHLVDFPPTNSNKFNILAKCAYMANGTESSFILQITGRNCLTLIAAVLWHHHSHRPCFLDVRRCNIVFVHFKHKKYM